MEKVEPEGTDPTDPTDRTDGTNRKDRTYEPARLRSTGVNSQRPTGFDFGVQRGRRQAGQEFALGQDADHGGVVGRVSLFGQPQGQSLALAGPGQVAAQGAVAGHAAGDGHTRGPEAERGPDGLGK